MEGYQGEMEGYQGEDESYSGGYGYRMAKKIKSNHYGRKH